jgi:hypothetical protein
MRKVVLEAHHDGNTRKDMTADGGRQSGRGGDWRRIQNKLEGESLSESLKSSTHRVCQTSRSNRKNNTPMKRGGGGGRGNGDKGIR